jgi:hypothetical protein
MRTNKANNGQRRNYRETMAPVGVSATAVDCPYCQFGGARVVHGQATANCFNCGRLLKIKWRTQ